MLNIASLPKHIEEIRVILDEKCLDILALNETRLNNNITNQDMFIHNYDLIRADRSRTGGGVCLYIRNAINYFERKDLNRDNLEAVCIEVNKPSLHRLLLVPFIDLQVLLSTLLPILSN